MSGQYPDQSGQSHATRKRSRTSEPPIGPPHVQKRDKYTTTACTEYRRRKIKCSGGLPCRRCDGYNLRCEYCQTSSEAGEQKNSSSRISKLERSLALVQSQVDQLRASITQMRDVDKNSQLYSNSNHSHNQSKTTQIVPSEPSTSPMQPHFIGTTSSAYNFNVANKTLQMMGIHEDERDDLSRAPSEVSIKSQSSIPVSDPLFGFSIEETYRAIQLFQDEIHPVYPFVPLEETIQHVPAVYQHIQHLRSSDSFGNACCTIKAQDVQVLKLIVACALVVEGRGESTVAGHLIKSVDAMMGVGAEELEVDIQGLRVFTLTSIYYFHADEPVLAWRTIGLAARIALEIGLHRKESLEQSFVNAQEREWALILFWCIYVLDRRWSFGIGLPFALQDSDVDPSLPNLHDREPYLNCLIAYGRICSKVWSAVTGFNNKLAENDTVAYLDFQIQQWQSSIPEEFQLLHPLQGNDATNQPRELQLLRVLLYVRANQMRGYVHRHCVLSATNISENLEGARRVTEIAKDTIRVLHHLRKTSTVYNTQQSTFNYFLASALSALFLAVCHAPAEFGQTCRNEFFTALEILKDFSAHSYVSRRLWKSLKSLRSIAPKLGLSPDKSAQNDQSNNQQGTRQQHVTGGASNTRTAGPTSVAASPRISDSGEFSASPISLTVVKPSPVMNEVLNVTPSYDSGSLDLPNMHQMGDEFLNIFEALENLVDTQEPQDFSGWMAKVGASSSQSELEISKLFEGFL